MCDHSESIHKNSCSKCHKINNINYLENQLKNLSVNSEYNYREDNGNTPLKSLLEFYDSIPDYDEINHLSNKEFYKKLDFLRKMQRTIYNCFINESKYGSNQYNSWHENYKAINNCKNSIIKYKVDDKNEDTDNFKGKDKPASRRSVRIESPEVKERDLSSKLSNTSRRCTRKYNKSPYNDSISPDGFSDCTLTTRSVPCSPIKRQTIFDDNTSKLIEKEKIDSNTEQGYCDKKVKSNISESLSSHDLFKANPVPITSRIPLFDHIMYEQEKRRQQVKRRSKESLKAKMNLFSFTKREEELAQIAHRLTKSSPDLFMCFENHKPRQFKAKPVPKNLFSNYAYQRMHEDQYYRSMQKKIRAEEMLKRASLPPSMAKREKNHNKVQICPKSFREIYENQIKKLPPSCRRDLLEKELAELELNYIMSTPSPVNQKPKSKGKKSKRKSVSSNSSKSSRSASTLESINRSNLAAVLRIQNARKKMEEDISRRLEEAQAKEEARWREKVLRKRPVWQSLTYSNEEDLNMRLQLRKDEEKLRNEQHRLQMETMFGRVNQQPTLFERQSNVKHARNKFNDSLFYNLETNRDKLLRETEDVASSVSSTRKCVEMDDEKLVETFTSDKVYND